MPKHRVFAMIFAKVYPLYVQKAERKNRTKEEVDQIICWLTGYSRYRAIRSVNAIIGEMAAYWDSKVT